MTSVTIKQTTEPVELFVANKTFVEKTEVEVVVQNKEVFGEDMFGEDMFGDDMFGEDMLDEDTSTEELWYCPGCEAGIDTKHSYNAHCCFE